MANRDFKKIERIMKDFSMGVGEGGGSSEGGMILVNELPEVGKEDTLYKLPDGTIWSCIYKTITDEFKVGGTYKVSNTIKQGLINYLTKDFTFSNVYYFVNYGSFPSLETGYGTSSLPNTNDIVIHTNDGDAKFLGSTDNSEDVDIQVSLESLTDTPTITIGEDFAYFTKEDGFELSDFEPLFILETHEVCEWTQISTSSSTSKAFAFGSSTFCPECIGFEEAIIDFDALATYLEEELNIDLDVTFITGEISFCTSLIGGSASLRISVFTSGPSKVVDVLSYDNTNPFLTTTIIDMDTNSLRDVFNELIKYSDDQQAVVLPHIYNANYTYDNICYIYRTSISDYEMFRLTDPEGFFKKILIEAGSSSGSDSSS